MCIIFQSDLARIFGKTGGKSRDCGTDSGVRGGFREKKFVLQRADVQVWRKKLRKKAKKNFGGLENGCIFAPAFDREAHPKGGRGPGSERTLKVMREMR